MSSSSSLTFTQSLQSPPKGKEEVSELEEFKFHQVIHVRGSSGQVKTYVGSLTLTGEQAVEANRCHDKVMSLLRKRFGEGVRSLDLKNQKVYLEKDSREDLDVSILNDMQREITTLKKLYGEIADQKKVQYDWSKSDHPDKEDTPLLERTNENESKGTLGERLKKEAQAHLSSLTGGISLSRLAQFFLELPQRFTKDTDDNVLRDDQPLKNQENKDKSGPPDGLDTTLNSNALIQYLETLKESIGNFLTDQAERLRANFNNK